MGCFFNVVGNRSSSTVFVVVLGCLFIVVRFACLSKVLWWFGVGFSMLVVVGNRCLSKVSFSCGLIVNGAGNRSLS